MGNYFLDILYVIQCKRISVCSISGKILVKSKFVINYVGIYIFRINFINSNRSNSSFETDRNRRESFLNLKYGITKCIVYSNKLRFSPSNFHLFLYFLEESLLSLGHEEP